MESFCQNRKTEHAIDDVEGVPPLEEFVGRCNSGGNDSETNNKGRGRKSSIENEVHHRSQSPGEKGESHQRTQSELKFVEVFCQLREAMHRDPDHWNSEDVVDVSEFGDDYAIGSE